MRSLSTRAAGLLILALGLWGGLVPFVGHYFHFALGPDKSWTWTSGRFYLSVLPGAVAAIGGLMLIRSGPRSSARVGALLALAAGAWFAIGPEVSLLWNSAGAQGVAHGSKVVRVLEMLTYHTALGVLITALAAYALPRFPKRAVAAEAGAAGAAVAADRPRTRDEQEPATRQHVAADEPVAARHDGVADEPVAARHDGVADEPVGTRHDGVADEPVGTRHDGVADEPAPARQEPAATGQAPTAVQERGYDGESPAGDREVDRAAPGHNGDGDRSEEPAATEAAPEQSAAEPASMQSAQPATMRGRRRSGGLLSRLRH